MSTHSREDWVSDKFVQFVDILFGFVVGQGFVKYTSLLLDPSSEWFSWWALVGIYTVVILSWISYHRAMSQYSYATEKIIGWLHMTADFLVVCAYARLLFLIEELKPGAQTAKLDQYVFGYVLVFVFFLLSGQLRILEHSDPNASVRHLMVYFGSFYLLLFGFYKFVFPPLGLDTAVVNWVIVMVCPVVYVYYRVRRHIVLPKRWIPGGPSRP